MLPDFEGIFALRQAYAYNGLQGVLFLYFDNARMAEEAKKVLGEYREVKEQLQKLEDGGQKTPCRLEDVAVFRKFFSVSEDSASPCGWSIREDDDKFRLWQLRCGWFCLFATDPELTANDALLAYRDWEWSEAALAACLAGRARSCLQ